MDPELLAAEELLTQPERLQVIGAFLTRRGRDGASEDEILQVVTWAVGARLHQGLLEGVLRGECGIDIDADGLRFFPYTKGSSQ